MEKEIFEVYLDDIIPNRFQPREKFNDASIKELSDSIKKYGVIQPLVLRKIGDKYEIIAGERRYKASTLAGLEKVPAIIKNLDDATSAEVALIENLQREDLTPIEKARSYKKLLAMSGEKQEELAKKLGISQPSLANTIRLLNLSEEVQEALLNRDISERHARSLLKISNERKQKDLLKRIIEERLTVRKLDSIIKNEDSEESGSSDIVDSNPLLHPEKETGEESMDENKVEEITKELEEPKPEEVEPPVIEEESKPEEIEPPVMEEESKPEEMENSFKPLIEEIEKQTITEDIKTDEEKPEEIELNSSMNTNSPSNQFMDESEEESDDGDGESKILESSPINDIESIKENAKDINTEVEKPDFDMLLQPEKIEEPQIELPKEEKIVDFPGNISLPNLDEQEVNLGPNLNEQPIEQIVSPLLEQEDKENINMGNNEEKEWAKPETEEKNSEEVQEQEKISPLMQEVKEPEPIVSKNSLIEETSEEENPLSEDSVKKPQGDLRIAINTVRRTVDIIENNGVEIESEEMDLENEYKITITIKK